MLIKVHSIVMKDLKMDIKNVKFNRNFYILDWIIQIVAGQTINCTKARMHKASTRITPENITPPPWYNKYRPTH